MNNEDKVYLTAEGLLELEEELAHLRDVKRPEVIKALKDARALGDLSENADYDAARDEQAQIEGRILELEKMLEKAHVIEKKNDDEIDEYRIVGSKEADPSNNKISNESPLAKAIMGRKKGEICSVESPNGKYDVKIVDIM